jgi:predicted small integral membrane protein
MQNRKRYSTGLLVRAVGLFWKGAAALNSKLLSLVCSCHGGERCLGLRWFCVADSGGVLAATAQPPDSIKKRREDAGDRFYVTLLSHRYTHKTGLIGLLEQQLAWALTDFSVETIAYEY